MINTEYIHFTIVHEENVGQVRAYWHTSHEL